jgi:predicted AAA+ superfamily ATPase
MLFKLPGELHLFFDLGIRRICANEGARLSDKMLGTLFEQFVGMELLRAIRIYNCSNPALKLKYWRDHAGPEVDYVIDLQDPYCPVEVKWTTLAKESHCKHLLTFMSEYDTTEYGYIVCKTPRRMLLAEKIIAIPWQELYAVVVPLLQK